MSGAAPPAGLDIECAEALHLDTSALATLLEAAALASKDDVRVRGG